MDPARTSGWLAEAVTGLGLPQGACYLRAYGFLPWWLGGSFIFGAVVLGGWALVRDHLGSFRAWGGGRLGPWRDRLGLAVFCALIVAAFDGAGFRDGFFRQDDFSFLEVARETGGLGRQMLLFHNDHLYLLYRLEVSTLVGLAGPAVSAPELAAWFNAVNFLTCTGLLLAGCWLLHELGGSRLSLFALAFFLWAWPGWGEFTAGYYTLSAFVQVQLLGFAASAAMLRGFRRDSVGWLAGSLALVLVALGINISGVGVAVGVFILGLAWHRRDPLPRRRSYLLTLLALLTMALGIYQFALRHPYSARELVQNPAGHAAGFGMADAALRHPLESMRTAITAGGGLAVNLVAPTFLQFAADRIIAVPLRRDLLLLGELLVVICLMVFARRRLGRLAGDDRRAILALAGCAGACLAMVIVARHDYALQAPASLWPAKYIVMPACWAWIGIVLFADRGWLAPTPSEPPSSGGLVAALAMGVWLTVSYGRWERTLFPEPLAYTARGRWGNVSNARARTWHYQRVMADLAEIAHFTGTRLVLLPEPSKWDVQFYQRHAVLEWGSDQSPSGVTYLFWDLLAASPGLHLEGRWIRGEALAPDLREFLAQYPWLQPNVPATSETAAGARAR